MKRQRGKAVGLHNSAKLVESGQAGRLGDPRGGALIPDNVAIILIQCGYCSGIQVSVMGADFWRRMAAIMR
jgi:hypothetical protein